MSKTLSSEKAHAARFFALLVAALLVLAVALCCGCSSKDDSADSGASGDAKTEQKESGDPVADDKAMVEANAGKDSGAEEEDEAAAPLTDAEKTAALEDADTLMRVHYASYNGLIFYLSDHGHTQAAAQYAADNCNADWNQEAVKCAQYYLNAMSMDREELLGQLEYEGFTDAQAKHAADSVGL